MKKDASSRKFVKNMKNHSDSRTSEIVLTAQLEVSDALSQDTLEHIEDLQEDLIYVSQSIEQARVRFAKVLAENRKLKAFLFQTMKNCWCAEGNRCTQCHNILNVLSNFEI